MTTLEEIEKWVLKAMAAPDALYQLVEVCRSVRELETFRCMDIAIARQSYSIPGNKDFDLGWKRCAEAIARDIRIGAGLELRDS